MKKTLKFLSMATLILAVATLTGCSKEEEQVAEPAVVKTCTTTVSIEGNEASKALTEAGVKTFEAGEQIAVVYENTSPTLVKEVITLTAGDITNAGKNATISLEMTNPKARGTLRIIYPAAMAGTNDVDYTLLYEQNGTLDQISSQFDLGLYEGTLTGEAELPASPELENPLTICEFTLKNEAGSGTLTGITALYIGDGENFYTVTPASATNDPLWVAMKPVSSSQWITFHATDGTHKYEKEDTGKTLTAGHMTPLGLKMNQLKEGALWGTFSVGSNDSDKVHFSQGNLKRVSGTWSFHDNQYDALGSWSSTACDLFYWETTGNYGSEENCVTSTGTSSDVVNWGVNAISNGGNVANAYSTPSTDNWQYLFNSRSGYSSKYGSATVCSQHGVVILPDHWTLPTGCFFTSGMSVWSTNSYDATAWAKMEAAGAVFLPAAGSRYGTGVNDVGLNGYYWSSTAYYGIYAWDVYFLEDNVDPGYHNRRNYGRSVRLVCE